MRPVAVHEPERPTLWHSIPLDLMVCAMAVIAAAGLKLAGVMP